MDQEQVWKNLGRVRELIFHLSSTRHHTRRDEFQPTMPIHMRIVNFLGDAFHHYPEDNESLKHVGSNTIISERDIINTSRAAKSSHLDVLQALVVRLVEFLQACLEAKRVHQPAFGHQTCPW